LKPLLLLAVLEDGWNFLPVPALAVLIFVDSFALNGDGYLKVIYVTGTP